jgi:hypothetical protein
MSESETEVFRLSTFHTNKCYAFALSTRTAGSWPNERFYTTHPLSHLGKYIRRESRGSGDGAKITEIFEDGRIDYNYEGTTCFVEVPCKQGGGKRKSKKSRRNAKSRKNQRRTRVR